MTKGHKEEFNQAETDDLHPSNVITKEGKETEARRFWCVQLHLHAVSYICAIKDDGSYDLDSKYYVKYFLCGEEFQSNDVSPTVDPYERDKPILVLETSEKVWATGSSSAVRRYFKRNQEMEVKIYRRKSNPRFMLKAKVSQ